MHTLVYTTLSILFSGLDLQGSGRALGTVQFFQKKVDNFASIFGEILGFLDEKAVSLKNGL